MQWSILDMVYARAFKPLPLCSAPLKSDLVEISGGSRNERKPFYKQKSVLRKCCGVSQKWWRLELPNLCHCVQHPWKLTSRDFWSSRNKRKLFSKQKCILEKMLWRISEMVYVRAFKPLLHCVQHPWKLTSRDFWSSRNDRKPLSQ